MNNYKCISNHVIRLNDRMLEVCVGDKIEVDMTERNGDILVGYRVDNTVIWKRVHASVLQDFKEEK